MKNLIKIRNNDHLKRSAKYGIAGVMFFVISICFSSCKKFVEVGLPDSQISGVAVFKDAATANLAVINIYVKLRENVLLTGNINTSGLSILLGNYADEIVFPPSTVTLPEERFFLNSLIPSNISVAFIWNDSYNLIYAANAVLEGLEQSSGISAQEKQRIQGEALFARGLIHFYLVNLFGSIPYVTTTDYRLNTKISKMTVDEVYAAVIADLKQAKILIPEAYPTAERVRPNRAVVTALLARAYLYHKNWAEAEGEATAVIENQLYTWVEDIDNVFLKESTGTLWQFIPNAPNLTTYEAQAFNFSNIGPTGTPQRILNEALLKAFEPDDLRATHWVAEQATTNGTFYYANKYKQTGNIGTTREYAIVFRLEEQYLIRAEARAMRDNTTGAQADINKIRNRAGLGNTPANTESELITAILQERRVELFTEHGHRFFDLKRTGKIDAALTPAIKPNWDAKDKLWPIPENELLLNPNLKPQNPGYGG